MRELDIGTKRHTKVIVNDGPGPGNACHSYDIQRILTSVATRARTLQSIRFQNGPVKENGVNGIHNEDLIAIVIDRLRGFQGGSYACIENHMALHCLEIALGELNGRTSRREQEGIEGTLGLDKSCQSTQVVRDPHISEAEKQARTEHKQKYDVLYPPPTPTPGTVDNVAKHLKAASPHFGEAEAQAQRETNKAHLAVMAGYRQADHLNPRLKPKAVNFRTKGKKEVEAYQWYPDMIMDGITPSPEGGGSFVGIAGISLFVHPGDWIIREPDGVHWYPCVAKIFNDTYEPILNRSNG